MMLVNTSLSDVWRDNPGCRRRMPSRWSALPYFMLPVYIVWSVLTIIFVHIY